MMNRIERNRLKLLRIDFSVGVQNPLVRADIDDFPDRAAGCRIVTDETAFCRVLLLSCQPLPIKVKAMAAKKEEKEGADGVIARNKKAFHDYQIIDSLEAGIALRGTEVKSCRMHSVSLQDSFAKIENGQVLLYNILNP